MKLGFIGTGEITKAVVIGILRSKLKVKKIYLSERNKKISSFLRKKNRNIQVEKDNQILNRKYEVKDLSEASGSIDLHKTILVQAAATNAETEYMLHIAESSDLVCGVVGWVNFEDKNQLNQLRIFSKHPKFIGVRPMIQDIPVVNWVFIKNFVIFPPFTALTSPKREIPIIAMALSRGV